MKTYKALVLLILVSFSFASYSQAYTSIHPDYKETFAPDKISGEKLTTEYSPVSTYFKAYVPPGSTKVTMIIYGPQGKVYGAAARVDNPLQCTYNLMSEEVAETLPWKKPNACSLDQMRTEDCQMNATDGQIEVLSWGMSPLTGEGHWIHVQILNHAQTELALVNFTVNVDLPAYTDWYESVSWNGNQPPDTAPGPTGGYCDPAWTGGSGETGGDEPAPPSTTTCDPAEEFSCLVGGAKWKPAPDCLCEDGEEPPPTELDITLNPLTNPDKTPIVISEEKLASSIETINVGGDFKLIFLWAGNEEKIFAGKVLELLREGKYTIMTSKGGRFKGVRFVESE